tara:strand:- start:745 stop:1974 length:1230 start_codon:yes stop_codon:yes gene_type:complete
MNVSIRKYPYPFQCAIAISSDIDNASSLKNFVQFMDFLNTRKQTKYGKGLDLEIGNSFWFFNSSGSPQLSYFEGLTFNETKMAPIIRSYIKSGHIDTLHSWGNFDRGGFKREYAKKGLEVCDEFNFKIPVWINHGIGSNFQKIGNYPNMYGDDPDHNAYHADIMKKIGCEYVWTGKSTHIIGQNAKTNFSVLIKIFIQWILKRTKYRNITDPIYDDGNNLFNILFLKDSNKMWEFTRYINSWGNAGILDLQELSEQLSPTVLNRLISSKGVMVLYTHFNENLFNEIPKKLYNNLKVLKEMNLKKNIFITTTSRLLKFWEISNYITYYIGQDEKKTNIFLNEFLDTPIGIKSIDIMHLQGLTFYVDTSKSCKIMFKGKKINTIINKTDETGRRSISIPWEKLHYPDVPIL